MTFRGSGPSGPAFNDQRSPAGPFPAYTTRPPPTGHPQYQHTGYLPQPGPLYPQQLPQHLPPQHVQYTANALPPMPLHDDSLQHAAFPSGQYGQPYLSQVAPQMPPQIPPQIPTFQDTHAQSVSMPPASAVQQMPPPSYRPPPPSSLNNSPKAAQRHRLSSEGAIQKTAKAPRRSPSGVAARFPVVSSSSLSDAPSVLVCLADEFLTTARTAAGSVAASHDANRVHEYHKLIATGLGCLEAALQSNKLSPRAETLVRLRYGSVLCEETENIMEAETNFHSAGTLCDKHRLVDLKLYVQFCFLKVLFRRNQKAAFIAVEGDVKDCETYKQVYWIYALRFLKASFYLQTGNAAEPHALENLRAIATLAAGRGEKAICVLALLLEGLAHLKAMREDAVDRVQSCIAQASKYQLDESVQIPQLEILRLFLDLSCSLTQKSPDLAVAKLNALLARMDDLKASPSWKATSSELLLPLRRQPMSSSTISKDTGSVIRPGDGEHDYLVLKAFSRDEAYALACTFSGVTWLYKNIACDTSFDYWDEALKYVSKCAKNALSTPLSLHEAIAQDKWRAEVQCYLQIVIGLHAATRSDWTKLHASIEVVNKQLPSSASGSLCCLAAYVRGVYEQGVGNLLAALKKFSDPLLALDTLGKGPHADRQVEFSLALLAAMNRLLIMQLEDYRDDKVATELLEQLERICPDYRDPEVKTAYNLVVAAIRGRPGVSINQVKRHIQQGVNGARFTNNIHCLSIGLNILRYRLFENVIGEQAVKSARAGSAQARRSGNLLWMSVADGMLAESLEFQGQIVEAMAMREAATQYANDSYDKTQVN